MEFYVLSIKAYAIPYCFVSRTDLVEFASHLLKKLGVDQSFNNRKTMFILFFEKKIYLAFIPVHVHGAD